MLFHALHALSKGVIPVAVITVAAPAACRRIALKDARRKPAGGGFLLGVSCPRCCRRPGGGWADKRHGGSACGRFVAVGGPAADYCAAGLVEVSLGWSRGMVCRRQSKEAVFSRPPGPTMYPHQKQCFEPEGKFRTHTGSCVQQQGDSDIALDMRGDEMPNSIAPCFHRNQLY